MINLEGNPRAEALREWEINVLSRNSLEWLLKHRIELVELIEDRKAYIERWEKEIPNMIDRGIAKRLMVDDIAKNRDWIENDLEIRLKMIDEKLNVNR